MLLRWPCLALASVALFEAGAPLQRPENQSVALFKLYQTGAYADFARGLASIDDFEQLRRDLGRASRAWPLQPRAGFLLEVAVAALESEARPDPDSPGARLFRAACADVRDLPAGSPFESIWNAAAIAVLDGPYAAGIDRDEHLGHVRQVDDGMRALASARGPERAAWHYLTFVQPGTVLRPEGSGPRLEAGAKTVDSALARLRRAALIPVAEPEARLRLGALLAAAGDHQGAMTELGHLPDLTEDARLRYLALMFAASVFTETARLSEAHDLYAAAAQIDPTWTSPLLAVAALDFGGNQRAETDAAAETFLHRDRRHDADPWLGFADGQWPDLGRRLDAMRLALR